jgi:hypothetical protein
MPLFSHQTIRKKPRKSGSIMSKLKRAFHRTPKAVGSDVIGNDFIDKFRVMFLRSMIVLMIGVSWWVAAPAIFLSLLPGFQVYLQTLTNAHWTVSSVYQFWQVVPEILLFSFSIVWTGGVLDMMFGNPVLEKVF